MKKDGRILHITEMCMLQWARGKTRLDHVRNVDIRKEPHMYLMAEFVREKKLRWFGHVQRREKYEAMREMAVDGSKRKEKSRQTKAEMARPGERKRRWQETR